MDGSPNKSMMQLFESSDSVRGDHTSIQDLLAATRKFILLTWIAEECSVHSLVSMWAVTNATIGVPFFGGVACTRLLSNISAFFQALFRRDKQRISLQMRYDPGGGGTSGIGEFAIVARSSRKTRVS